MSTIRLERLENPNTSNGGIDIDSSGNVGIGTTTPGTKLEVGGAVTSKTSTAGLSDQSITFTESGSGNAYGVRLGHVSNTEIAFERYDSGWAETVRIDGSGRVLVGATTASGSAGSAPYALLQIEGNTFSGTGPGSIALRSGTASASIGSGGEVGQIAFAGNDNEEFALISCEADAATGSGDHPGRFVFKTTPDGQSSPTERMRIDSSGVLSVTSTATNGRINVGDPDNFIYGDTSNNLILGTNASERIQINSNGLIDTKGGQLWTYGAIGGYQPNTSASITCIAAEAVMYRVSVSIHYGGTSVDQEIGYLVFSNTSGGYNYDQVVSSTAITVSVSYGGPSTATVTATGPASSTALYLRMLRMS